MSAATLAARVKARREELGLTQRQIPGIDHGLLSRIESGKVKDPAGSTLQALSKALGLSLDELGGAPASVVRMLELRAITPDPENPRRITDSAEDQALVDSIRQLGLLQPLAVRVFGEGWMVVDGHRRLAALAQLHGPKAKTLVPVRIVEADDGKTLLMQLVANVQRADMNPMDLADGITRLVDGKMDTQEIANALGRKRRWVQEQASVGRHLTADAKDALRNGMISISQAVAIAAERDEEKQNDLLARVGLQNLGEDDIRALIADGKAQAAAAEADRQPDLLKGGDEDPKPTIPARDVIKPVGGWKTWRTDQGYFKWRLNQQQGLNAYVVETDCQWRRSGCTIMGWGTIGREPKATTAEALAVAAIGAWAEFDQFAEPKDKAALLTSLLPWLEKGLRNLGAFDELVARVTAKLTKRIEDKLGGPEKTRAAAKPKPPAEPALTKAQLAKLPGWASAMEQSYFVILEGGSATLVKGWKALAETMFGLYELHEPQTLRAMMDRSQWENDVEGKPFDFGSVAYRITDMKARGWSK